MVTVSVLNIGDVLQPHFGTDHGSEKLSLFEALQVMRGHFDESLSEYAWSESLTSGPRSC